METIEMCVTCKKEPIFIKKRGLCKRCYNRVWGRENGNGVWTPTQNTILKNYNKTHCVKVVANIQHRSEILFIQNFFKHNNWVYQPAKFRLNETSYSPDFYDCERNVFIEVVGTRQAYSQNQFKYTLFRELFPKLKLEIRNAVGDLIDTEEPINRQTTEKALYVL